MKWLRKLFQAVGKKSEITPPKDQSEDKEPEMGQKDEVASDLDNVRNKAEGYELRDLGDGMYFVHLAHGRACWLYNEKMAELIPLVARSGSVLFLEESDIEETAAARIAEECPQYAIYAHFRFWVYAFKDGLADVEWTVCPDGMYWADEDGYGMEDDEEISLHGKITMDGNPTGKFHLYERKH